MSLSPQGLLSLAARERCVRCIKDLPVLVRDKEKIKELAAVLVPICIENGEVCLLYTLRSSNLKSHGSQVSFPGGKVDNDEGHIAAALRETEEEIGVPPEKVDIWAEMPQIEGRKKGLVVTPVVGEIKDFQFNKLVPSVHEVEEIFTVPVSHFCDTNNQASMDFNNIFIPLYLYKKHKIWGLTGMITHLFLECFIPNSEYKFRSKKKFTLDELMPPNSSKL